MTPTPDKSELLELAMSLARSAGERVVEMRAQSVAELSIETKSSDVDLVTAADRAAEQLIIDGLEAARPGDGILGEEGASKPTSTGVRWIIDPIDGTTNYVYDLPAYTVSIAAEFDGELIVGVVHEPKNDTLFAASQGRGATRNGEPISCSQTDGLPTALVATGFGFKAERRAAQAELLTTVLPRVRDIRRFGSAALDLCLVASGGVDGYYERGLNPWDFAAGVVIAAEAGASVGNLRGGPADDRFVLAAAPGVFGPLRRTLGDLDADQIP